MTIIYEGIIYLVCFCFFWHFGSDLIWFTFRYSVYSSICVCLCVCTCLVVLHWRYKDKAFLLWFSFYFVLRSIVTYYCLYSKVLPSFLPLLLLLWLSLLSTLYTKFHYCNWLPIFSVVATYILFLYGFPNWFPYFYIFLPKLYIINLLIF